MNKILAAVQVVAIIVLSLCVNVNAFANSGEATDDQIAQRVESLYSIVDMKYTPEVSKVIRQYTKQYTKSSSILLGQSSIYFPIIENILREHKMPEELKYLAVVESSLKPTAKSYVGATGLWQFMKSTGKMYGLTINSTVDERKDVIKSTHSAVQYLKDLHERFGDWTLAMAAYNCGPGRVSRAIRKSGSKDFWVLKKYLPKETRRYVPKFIAMQYLMSYYHMHNIAPDLPEEEFRFIASTKVFKKVSFGELSRSLDVNLNIIKKLNPAFSKNYIPTASKGAFHLTLPEQKLFTFVSNHGSLSDVVYSRNSVVFKKYVDSHIDRIELSILQLKSVKPGLLEFETNKEERKKQIIEALPTQVITNNQRKMHLLKKGENLKDVARMYDLTLAQLLQMNDITGLGDIEYGDTLIIEE
jgi:membrane-bound lytic murein transglycosylase D